MNTLVFLASEDDSNKRIDSFLSEKIDNISRSSISKYIANENVTVNDKAVSKSYRLVEGDKVIVNIEEPKPLDIVAENIPLDIVFEDNDILVVNKPKGMVVHPAAGNYEHTLVNALMHHCKDSLSGINGVLRPGIVHRIDKNTSGLLVIAKNDIAHNRLAQQIKDHSFTREYKAISYGNLKTESGTINAPIGRHKTDRKRMCVTEKNSKSAITHYYVLQHLKGFDYIKCVLETGRTHQIRVHMAYIGHPLAGDDVYGPKRVITELEGQCLHAYKLGFIHPISGGYLEFTAEVPTTFKLFLDKLNKISE